MEFKFQPNGITICAQKQNLGLHVHVHACVNPRGQKEFPAKELHIVRCGRCVNALLFKIFLNITKDY